jgi:hypothetical protein
VNNTTIHRGPFSVTAPLTATEHNSYCLRCAIRATFAKRDASCMVKYELLRKLRMIVGELEYRQTLIKQWIGSEDPDLVLLGTYQQEVVNRQHSLLVALMIEIQRDGLTEQ